MTFDGLCSRSVEFRSSGSSDGDGRTLEGYAAVFGAETEISSWEGRFTEQIAKGAFRKTLRERKNVILQWNHGGDSRVGQTPIGVYEEIREDDHGLYVKGRLFDNDVVEPVRQAIEAGAVSGMSFKFRVVRDDWSDNAGKRVKPDELYELLYDAGERGPLKRTIKEVQLFEAGPVSTPAYAQTSVGVRSVSEEDRKDLVDQYRRSLADEAREESERVQSWLEAEERWAKDYSDWVDAETTWRASVTDWLAAEQAHITSTAETDAARQGTSEPAGGNPDPTPTPEVTSVRESKETNAIQKVSKAMNVHELRAREKALLATLTNLGNEFRDAEMPAEKAEAFDAAESELGEVRGKIEAIEARAEKMKSYAVSTPESTERGNDRQGPAFHKDRDIFDVDATRSESRSPEDFVARLKDDALRAADKVRFSRVTSKENAQARMTELLEDYDDDNGTLAKRILITGSPVYERAFSKALKSGSLAGLDMEEQRAMTLGGQAGAEGGFAVPVQLDPTVILTNDGHIGDLRSLARVETIVGKEWQGVTSEGINVSRDGSPASASYPTPGEIGRQPETGVNAEAADASFYLGQPKVSATRVQGFVPFTIEIEQDWGGLRSEITRMLADAKGREENESFVLGDGTGLQPFGVVGSLAAGQEVTAAGEAIAAADIYAMETALAPRWRANAQWLANKAIYNKIRQLGGAQDHAFWAFIGGGVPERLLGYSVNENSYMDGTINDAVTESNRVLLFGDFKQFLIVDRVGMNVELVPHVFGANGRPTGQRGVYAIWRNNAKVLVPNAFRVLKVATTSP